MAAKALKIKVNPQFGQLDYNQIAIVTVPSSVARPGPAKATSHAGLSPLADRPRDQPAGGARPAQLAGLGGAAVR